MTKSAFDKIAAGLEDAIAFMEGDDTGARVHLGLDVPAIRAKTGLSQAEFAERIHVSIKTLQNWEQGRRMPDGAAKTLLRAVDKEPETLMRLLETI